MVQSSAKECKVKWQGLGTYQVWVDLQSCIIAFHSLGDKPLLHQGTGHVVVCICETGLQAQGRLHVTALSWTAVKRCISMGNSFLSEEKISLS